MEASNRRLQPFLTLLHCSQKVEGSFQMLAFFLKLHTCLSQTEADIHGHSYANPNTAKHLERTGKANVQCKAAIPGNIFKLLQLLAVMRVYRV